MRRKRHHHPTEAVHKKNVITAFNIFMKNKTKDKIYVVRRNKKTFVFFNCDAEYEQELFEYSSLTSRTIYEIYEYNDFEGILDKHYDTMKKPIDRSTNHWFSNWNVIVTDRLFNTKEKKFINLLNTISKYDTDGWNIKNAIDVILDSVPPKYVPILFNVRKL